MVKILFICKYNAFRSRISEEYFNKISKNNNVGIISRGIIMGGDSDKEQRRLAKQILGINIAKRKPLPLRLQEMIDADKIIVVANDVPRIIFNYKIVNLQKKSYYLENKG
jgi:protein-tyrosine-phosphatase